MGESREEVNSVRNEWPWQCLVRHSRLLHTPTVYSKPREAKRFSRSLPYFVHKTFNHVTSGVSTASARRTRQACFHCGLQQAGHSPQAAPWRTAGYTARRLRFAATAPSACSRACIARVIRA